MSETARTCGSCGAQIAGADRRCPECGEPAGRSAGAALFSMSRMSAQSAAEAVNEFRDIPTEVGPYLQAQLDDFAEGPDTLVATSTRLLYSCKRAYGPGETITLLVYDPDAAERSVGVGLFMGGGELSRATVELDGAGAGIARFEPAAPGQAEARFLTGGDERSDYFIVVDAWPVGLQASINEAYLNGNPAQRWLALALQLGVSGAPYDGSAQLELLDRDSVVSHQHVRVANGEAHARLAVAGHSPHTLSITAAGRDDVISVPLDWSIHPVELSTGGSAVSIYPVTGAALRDGLYVLDHRTNELPDLGNQLSPRIEARPHCARGEAANARLDAGVGAQASAWVTIRAARGRHLQTPGRAIAASALQQLDVSSGAPPASMGLSCPPFARSSLVSAQLLVTDGSGRLDIEVPTEQPGDWIIDAFVMTDLGWGEAEARIRVD